MLVVAFFCMYGVKYCSFFKMTVTAFAIYAILWLFVQFAFRFAASVAVSTTVAFAAEL